jgi:hypothetical protein
MTRTINLFSLIWVPFIVLLMVGVIPFTAVSVGAAIILSHVEITLSWSR